MILVDTSILISFLRGIDNKGTEKFEDIILRNIPFGINNYIYQELLQGAASEKDFNNLKQYLETQKFYNLKYGKKSFEDAAKIYYICRKSGFTIRSTIDLIIAQTAIENDLLLLHDDVDYVHIAKIITKLNLY
jgi:predicted nucleic acid-binding protein